MSEAAAIEFAWKLHIAVLFVGVYLWVFKGPDRREEG